MILFSLGEFQKTRYIESSSPLHLYAWENIKIHGSVEKAGTSAGGRVVYVINVLKTQFPEGSEWGQHYKIRVYGDKTSEELMHGQEIEADIRLYEFPEKRNPHEFNYGSWLHQQQITAHGKLDSLLATTQKNGFGWGQLRTSIQNNVDHLFSKKHAPLVKALVLGNKEELTPETKKEFSRAGLSHIMAVSGLHVGFIVAPFWLIIPFLWNTGKGKWAGLLFLTLLLTGYAGLTGFSASVSRASLMAWLLTYGRLFHKVRNSINLASIAAIILLFINPNQLFDVGFQLSFCAVFIILLIMPEAQRLIPQKFRYGKTGSLLTIIVVSIVVQAGLFPLLVYYFGEFSVIGPIANALVVPLLSITVPVALLFSILSPIDIIATETAIMPIEFAFDWIHGVASYLGSLEASYITISSYSLSLFLIWIMAILFIATLRIPVVRWKIFIMLLCTLNIFLIEQLIKEDHHQSMVVTFLDVGQGDSVHIKTPAGKHILLDTGRWSPSANSGDRILLPYLEAMGVNKIDALILSHPHADHIGGVLPLLENVRVGEIYQSNYAYNSSLYQKYMDVASEKQIPVKTPVAGQQIKIDPAMRLFVLGPESGKTPSNPNNHSLVIKMVYGETSILFSGDAEKEQEQSVSARYGDFLRANIYKTGHHGSNTSSTEKFIMFIEPDVAVSSLAFRNYFGHPGKETVARLKKFSNTQEFTSLTGAVRYQSDGTRFWRVSW